MHKLETRKPRNHEIEFWRFFFACMVFSCHVGVLQYGSLAVEFFFLLTGYLTMVSIEKRASKITCSESTFDFIIRKIKSFYPELLAASVISVIVVFYACEITLPLIRDAIKTIVNGVIPLKMTGIGISVRDFNGATWYLSSMIIGLLITYPLLVRYGAHPILFILGILICGFLCEAHGQLGYVYTYLGFTFEGNLRAIGELLIGASMLRAVQWLSKSHFTRTGTILITLMKYACILSIVAIASLNNTSYHGLALCAAILALILILSEKGIDSPLFNNKISLFLGALSLPLYLSHIAIATHIKPLLSINYPPLQPSLICFYLSILAALMVMLLAKILRKSWRKLRRIIIAD